MNTTLVAISAFLVGGGPLPQFPEMQESCRSGFVRYRRSDWGADPHGGITASVTPTSSAEWVYVSDGRGATFHAASDCDEQRRILGRWTAFVNLREREATVLRGQHSPAPEGIDELLLGCEGLADSVACETLAEEVSDARQLSREQSGEHVCLKYTLPGEAAGWSHGVEWLAGPTPRLLARTLEIPSQSTVPEASPSSRVVRSEIVEWEEVRGVFLPRVVERSVSSVGAGSAVSVIGRSRFEVVERRESLTDAERMRIGQVHVDDGWAVSIQSLSITGVIGSCEFTFAGHRYAAAIPVTLDSLHDPSVLLEGAQCLE